MADQDETKTSLGEKSDPEGLEPKTSPSSMDALSPSNEQRSLDVGESGQFAPGGRYNELGVTAPRRIDLDEQVDSALKDEEK